MKEIERAASLAIVIEATVVLATGCSSTGAEFGAGLISPSPDNQRFRVDAMTVIADTYQGTDVIHWKIN